MPARLRAVSAAKGMASSNPMMTGDIHRNNDSDTA